MEQPTLEFRVPGLKIKVPLRILPWFRKPTSDRVQQIVRMLEWIGPSPEIRMHIAGYTLQDTFSQLLVLVNSIGTRPFPSVTIRTLRPNLARPLSIWDSSDRRDRRYWEGIQEAEAAGQNLRQWIENRFANVKFDQRVFPFDPSIKCTVVNETHAFFGLYAAERHTKRGTRVKALDYVGNKIELIEVNRGQGGVGGALFEELTTWFDKTWNMGSMGAKPAAGIGASRLLTSGDQ